MTGCSAEALPLNGEECAYFLFFSFLLVGCAFVILAGEVDSEARLCFGFRVVNR